MLKTPSTDLLCTRQVPSGMDTGVTARQMVRAGVDVFLCHDTLHHLVKDVRLDRALGGRLQTCGGRARRRGSGLRVHRTLVTDFLRRHFCTNHTYRRKTVLVDVGVKLSGRKVLVGDVGGQALDNAAFTRVVLADALKKTGLVSLT